MSLPELLTVLTNPWAIGVATVLLVFTGGGLIYGEDSRATWILRRLLGTLCLVVLGVHCLSALGVVP